jgi:hypothetical protein
MQEGYALIFVIFFKDFPLLLFFAAGPAYGEDEKSRSRMTSLFTYTECLLRPLSLLRRFFGVGLLAMKQG